MQHLAAFSMKRKLLPKHSGGINSKNDHARSLSACDRLPDVAPARIVLTVA
jgi:hypothetical protein